jgi:hypothetical protein
MKEVRIGDDVDSVSEVDVGGGIIIVVAVNLLSDWL